MEEIVRLFTDTSSNQLLFYFVKAFLVLFSVMYLFFAIVLTRQTQVMTRTFQTSMSYVLITISVIQVIFAVILIYTSIAFL